MLHKKPYINLIYKTKLISGNTDKNSKISKLLKVATATRVII